MMRSLHVMSFALCVAAGCSDEEAGPPRIEATVGYSGSAQGTLTVAAFPDMPPKMAPMAFAQKAAPAFPVTLVLEAVEPGDVVYVLATLDLSPASPQQPGPEDRASWSSAVTVAAEGATTINLTLVDP